MFEQENQELKSFLSSLECVKAVQGQGGPVQDTPEPSSAREAGLAIRLPLPWAYRHNFPNLPDQIMDEVEKWAESRGLERFGQIIVGDLFIGLRKPEVAS